MVRRLDAPENEHGVANERVAQKRPSQSFWPRVMRCRPRGLQPSVDRGSRRRGIEPRNTRTRISPLLANLYMRHFLLGRKQAGWDRKLKAHIVNYADDFVILCRATAESARAAMMGKLRLKVNQQKTRVLSSAQRIVRYSGLHAGPVSSDANRKSLHWYQALEEEGGTNL
jgi:hypothetical protein